MRRRFGGAGRTKSCVNRPFGPTFAGGGAVRVAAVPPSSLHHDARHAPAAIDGRAVVLRPARHQSRRRSAFPIERRNPLVGRRARRRRGFGETDVARIRVERLRASCSRVPGELARPLARGARVAELAQIADRADVRRRGARNPELRCLSAPPLQTAMYPTVQVLPLMQLQEPTL